MKGIEPVIRKAVEMEIERGTEGGTDRVVERVMKRLIPTLSIQSVNPRCCCRTSEQVEFQLQFANKLPKTIYTKDKIRDKSDGSIQIKLTDTISRETQNVDREIEIVVLDGDFGFDENENWTEMEFNAKIVDQREGKGPLVKGKQKIKLRGGVGIIEDLSFSDNSSWIKCKMFRLGARVLQSTSNMGQMRIKEAVSEAFAVNDFRASKHHVENMIQERNRRMNRQMQELNKKMNREMQELKAEMNKKMNREMQELKADMIQDMQRLVRSSSAKWNVNARSSLDYLLKKSEERELRLVFVNQLSDKIFTKDKIRDESGESIQIKLIDTISTTREIVELDPLSSIVIEIVVLDGDFGSEGNENWTEQEFNTKIVHQREDKGPLVKGKQNIKLRGGVGTIQDFSFSDNSSWIKCKKFRLGARVLQSTSNMGQMRIKEAVSEAFAVNDFRMRKYHVERNKKHFLPSSKKHYLPSLDDEVWHLKKIEKGGKFHKRLIDNNIHTVRDFKQMCRINLNKLREILKDCSDSDWEVIERDASCVVDDDEKLNAYSDSLISPTTGDKKQVLPSLKDEVWHLKKEKKGGKFHTRLIDNNIQTVRHFKEMYKQNPNKLREILKDCSDLDWEVIVKHASCVVDDESTVLHQGSTGMQNYRNHASSSHGHKGGFSTEEETVPNLASQPLATSTDYPVNAQGVQSNSNFHPPTNGVSGWNSSQSNEHGIHCSPNYNPLMTESSQINNGPHPHFHVALHLSNAFDDVRHNAYSNNPTTGSLCHEFPLPQQVFSQNNNGPLSHISDVQHASYALEANSNPLIIPESEAYYSPTTGLAGMHNDYNHASSSQYLSDELRQQIVPNDVYGDPEWNPSQFNGISNFPPSTNNYSMTEYSQNNDGLLEQNTVTTLDVNWNELSSLFKS